tara:strand:- start:12616 stop:13578 length:963 start_codon:yes stop_codon:yes gene_type:complete
MATAPIYCTHKELKRVYPQIDAFDTKTPLYGWVTVTTNKYASHNSGAVTQLFADGEDLGAAQSAHTDLNVEGEWFYNSAEDVCYYYSASSPLDKLMEAGEEFTTMVTQFRTDASRYLDSKLDPNLPREQLKDKSGNFDYMIIRSSALIAAAFLIRANDPTNEVATALMEEAQGNIDALNDGKAALSWQTTRDASKGIIRDVSYTDGSVRPVDTRGNWNGTFDLIRVLIVNGGALDGTATYSVWVKNADKLGNQQGDQVITAEKINGDYQALAGGLQIRFAGETKSSVATATNEWEIEVMGAGEHIDASGVKSVANSRWSS